MAIYGNCYRATPSLRIIFGMAVWRSGNALVSIKPTLSGLSVG